MDSDSDLSDLDQEYGVDPPSAPDTYIPRHVLRPPVNGTYSTESIHQWINAGDVELEPEYQRAVVWPETKQIKLIDSLLRNFYVPPIIFRRIGMPDGGEKRICIDGKQRLTSIQRFMDGLIPHVDMYTKQKYWFKPGHKKTMLPPNLIKTFKSKQIVCIEYCELEESWEREIFQRVQLGMPLLPAERMTAHTGPWVDFTNEIKQKYLRGEEGLLQYISYDTARAKDFLASAQIINAIDQLPGKPSIGSTSVEKWLQRTDPPSEGFRRQVISVMDTYLKVAPMFEQGRVSPVELVLIAILIYLNLGKSIGRLETRINDLRSHLKAHHDDIRFNNKVIATAFDFFHPDLTNNKGKKRRRDDDDDDREEYRGSPISKVEGAPTTRPTTRNRVTPAKRSSKTSTPSTKSSRTACSTNPVPSSSSTNRRTEQPAPDPPQESPSAPQPPSLLVPKEEPEPDALAKLRKYKDRINLYPPSSLGSPTGPLTTSATSGHATDIGGPLATQGAIPVKQSPGLPKTPVRDPNLAGSLKEFFGQGDPAVCRAEECDIQPYPDLRTKVSSLAAAVTPSESLFRKSAVL
ncbi:hypothetical protein FRB99_008901 [Tulasnella sp. 403]|nr:hypothetical protein FRB99_008901 [Tulasnella sp. 403]